MNSEDKNVTLRQMTDFAQKNDKRIDTLEELTKKERQGIYEPVAFTIPVDGWETDAAVPKFPVFYTVMDENITAKDKVAVDVAPRSTDIARSANFTTTESFDGGFRVRAKRVPKEPIEAQYHIMNTAVYLADKEV